ncbi:nephrocan-like [Bufo gargarizans]|uniref:nephrocan-like n=1 Tax=Bufo gargarizans TaxID=30331 RepID=UPI001CF1DAB5|nr:nephrocan-like [Bufo gargarizans]
MASCPRRCSCDSPRTIQCYRVSAIPSNVPATIGKLYISHSKIRRVQFLDFGEMPGLQELVLFSCGIETIENNTFKALNNLKMLEVWKNKLTSIPQSLPSKLEVLKLGDNSICSLNLQDFDGLTKLRILEVQNNLLSTLSFEVFSPLSNLQTLILDGNGMHTISGVSRLLNLKYLNMENNKLMFFYENFFTHFPSLQYLRIAGNQLIRVPPQLPKSLLSLRLERNYLKSVRVRELKQLENLFDLNLSGNQLFSVDGLHVVTNLTSLDLSKNQLSTLPHKLPTKLQRLDYSNNQISRITVQDMKGLASLKHLFLDNNGMIVFEDKALQGCGHLSNLAMEQNLLTSLPLGLPATLTRLDLKGNKIDHVGVHDVKELKHLQVLNLRNNKLTSIDDNVLESLPRLRHLHLDGNPWNCTCSLLKVRRLLLDKGTDIKEGQCAEPPYCRGERWMSSNTMLRQCETYYTFDKGKESKKKLKVSEASNGKPHIDEDEDYDSEY